MVANTPDAVLDKEQVDFLLEHHEVLDALFELAQTDEFIAKFGELPVAEVMKRLANTLDRDDEPDLILRERYQRLKTDLETDNQAALLTKLRGSSLFDDLNDENEA
ncbi:MAG: hypothetical protein ABI690_05060 [Chloroflexota bacterium]